MKMQTPMQQALGEQWPQLPRALRQHYQEAAHTDVGALDIEYPAFMQPGLSLLHRLGALVHRRGQAVSTTVEKWMDGPTLRWKRTLRFADGREILFKSHWTHAGGNELIEYVNPWLGLRMAVSVEESQLIYHGRHFVLKLGRCQLPIPEWLLLGHTHIVETARDERHFAMDFRLTHPLLGQIYRYAGTFRS